MRIDFHGTKTNPTAIGIVGNPDTNEYLYITDDISYGIEYIQRVGGWAKDPSVGPLILSLTSEENPEFFI
jgi:hypothetical protein